MPVDPSSDATVPRKIPGWVLLLIGLTGVAALVVLAMVDRNGGGPFWLWLVTSLLVLTLIPFAIGTYAEQKGWTLAQRRRRRK